MDCAGPPVEVPLAPPALPEALGPPVAVGAVELPLPLPFPVGEVVRLPEGLLEPVEVGTSVAGSDKVST